MSATKIYNEKYSALKLDEIENIEEKKAVLDSFSDKYLLLPEAWIIRLQLEIAANASYETVKELLKRALFDFYTPKFLEAIPFNFQQRFMKEERPFNMLVNHSTLNILSENVNENFEEDLINAIKLPNPYLNIIYYTLEEFSGKKLKHIIIYRFYQKSKKNYENMEASKENISEWFKTVLNFGSFRFFVQTVENRIAEEPLNIELWKLYIEHLQKNHKNMSNKIFLTPETFKKLMCLKKSLNTVALYLLVTNDSMNMDLNEFLNFFSKISSTKARHTISFDAEVNEVDKEIFRGMFNIAKDQWKQINDKELPNIHVSI